MNAPQGTAAWRLERAGYCTASRASDVLAKLKNGGEAITRRKYRLQLCVERLTGVPVDGYQNAAMLWGIATEREAREAYEVARGVMVEETGFIPHPSVAWCGASPDGALGDDGLLEVKCPESTTHLQWLRDGIVPSEHVPQLAFQLWVTGRKFVDFASYDPRFPERLRLSIVRYERDQAKIDEIAKETEIFLREVERDLKQLAP